MSDALLCAVRKRKLIACSRGKEYAVLDQITAKREAKEAKLVELYTWMQEADKELRGVLKSDERWATFDKVAVAYAALREEIGTLEDEEEAAFTAVLERTGPITVEKEDASKEVWSANGRASGGGTVRLPADILRVWRVCRVFEGSVLLAGERVELRFGDKAQIATVKAAPKQKKQKGLEQSGEGFFARE